MHGLFSNQDLVLRRTPIRFVKEEAGMCALTHQEVPLNGKPATPGASCKALL